MDQTAPVLLTISNTAQPADDLGYLLYKHPGKVQSFDLPVGRAHVFYPEATAQRCTVALLLEIDPIALVRGKAGRGSGSEAFSLGQYVNDRPYAASSMLAVALGRVFSTAMTGRSDSRPELAAGPLPLEVHIPALPCRGGSQLARRLFGPMGWTVSATPIPADPEVPSWGDSPYVDLLLTGDVRLADALHHLYVLLPVLDDGKHYWVGTDEIDKLIRAGAGWLTAHPERELITRRYLAHQRDLVVSAVGRLAEIDDVDPDVLDNAVPEPPVLENAVPETPLLGNAVLETPLLGTAVLETPVLETPVLETPVLETPAPDGPSAAAALDPVPARTSLADERRDAVLAALRSARASSVVDLGCGEGALLRAMLADFSFDRILGVDVSHRALELAARRLRLDTIPDAQRRRVELLQSSLTYRDDRLSGFDAMVLMEVIEHVDPPRLDAVRRSVFAAARPETVVITTPNAEYNVRYPGLAPGAFRHRDHRFEWTRAQFRAWSNEAAAEHGYLVRYLSVGRDDPDVGPETQLAVFTRISTRISTEESAEESEIESTKEATG